MELEVIVDVGQVQERRKNLVHTLILVNHKSSNKRFSNRFAYLATIFFQCCIINEIKILIAVGNIWIFFETILSRDFICQWRWMGCVRRGGGAAEVLHFLLGEKGQNNSLSGRRGTPHFPPNSGKPYPMTYVTIC